jgi:hypothetical protein
MEQQAHSKIERLAELIDALCDFDGMTEPSIPGTPHKLRRIRTALARVQGGEP